MALSQQQQDMLRQIPAVDQVLLTAKSDPYLTQIPQSVMVRNVRVTVDELRNNILSNPSGVDQTDLEDRSIMNLLTFHVQKDMALNLKRTVNATGVIIHTNLGRSLLSLQAIDNLIDISTHYSNLEFNLSTGKRGSRYSNVEDLVCELTGAQAAMVVNNNAGAVLLCLDTIAKGKHAIVSRGELVEIGGSFRIPDVMAKSGAILKEVGTTNRTHLKDYANAIDENTGILLKVHKSNYAIVGFSKEVGLSELVELGQKHHIVVMEDLGSGTLIDFSRYGLYREPTVQDSVAAGTDVVTFSGDKLLGGPQAGIIVGKKSVIDDIKANPLTRALRIDKMTLAAFESTLRLYRDPEKAVSQIPTLRMITMPLDIIKDRAETLFNALDSINNGLMKINQIQMSSKTGGGALPLLDLPSLCLGITINALSANDILNFMRDYSPPVIGRIENDMFIMDPRTLQEDEFDIITNAFKQLLDQIS